MKFILNRDAKSGQMKLLVGKIEQTQIAHTDKFGARPNIYALYINPKFKQNLKQSEYDAVMAFNRMNKTEAPAKKEDQVTEENNVSDLAGLTKKELLAIASEWYAEKEIKNLKKDEIIELIEKSKEEEK